MKLIIDIDEYTFERIKEYYDALPEGITVDANVCYIANGTPIPDNATNGEVIKAIFPNIDIEIHNITVYVIFDMYSNVIPFDLDWWNAPYQKGGKE